MPQFAPPTAPLSLRRHAWCLGLAIVAALPGLLPAAAEEPVAVFSTVFNGYTRTRLPDQSFKPEFYVFGEGGCRTRPVDGSTVEQLDFVRIARTVAPLLARRNYRPALKSAEADLLILVFWGSTAGSNGTDHADAKNHLAAANSVAADASANNAAYETARASNIPTGEDPAHLEAVAQSADAARDTALWQMELANRDRDQLDDLNAQILGYSESLSRARFAAHMSLGQDVLAEISANRYYVVLQAYDFATARKMKKLKPLWTARLSMNERGEFAAALTNMLDKGARYFGEDSRGLRRDVTPEGRVELGPTKVLPDK